MFSNLIITHQQKFILFVDNTNLERHSNQMIQKWLEEQGQNIIQIIPDDTNIDSRSTLENDIITQLTNLQQKTNIILQPLSDLLINMNSSSVFHLINQLKKCPQVKQTFLWASVKNVSEHFVIPFLQYMSDIVVTFTNPNNLSILTRKSGGTITNKFYSYHMIGGKFSIQEQKKSLQKIIEPTINPESLGTFKINLDEDELIARNALKLPYERTTDSSKESKIEYIPDADDDFDEEDPDEDLYI